MQFSSPQLRAPRHPKYDAIHRALLTGLLSNVGTKGDAYEYFGTRGGKFAIFPGSALFSAKPKWLVAAELVETTKLYARTCAAVQPQWIERAASHLVERTYSEPRWDARTGSVIATEKVTLHGLVLIPARIVQYGPINPKLARELFIHHGLVLGEVRTQGAFLRSNQALLAEVELLEAKIRQRNLLADAATRFAFYEARVPLEVNHAAGFETWRRAAERQNPRLLLMSREDLLRADAPAISRENYPDKLSDPAGTLRLPLNYRYEPGEVTDGLTLAVPIAALPQLRPQRYEWLVPGMLEEKIAALLRALPGTLRRNFVPVPSWARAAAEAIGNKPAPSGASDAASDISLREALAAWLARQTGVDVKPEDFPEQELQPHLRMNFKVIDDAGQVLGLSRDLPALQRKLAREASETFAGIHQRQFNRDGIAAWDFGDLPESVTVQRFNMSIVAYPALVDQGESCGLRLLASKEDAAEAHIAGVRRLFWIAHRREIKTLTGKLPDFAKMKLQYLLLGRSAELRDDLLILIVTRALFGNMAGGGESGEVPRKAAEFEAMVRQRAGHLNDAAERVGAVVAAILEEHLKLALVVEAGATAEVGSQLRRALIDVHDQVVYLLPRHFLIHTEYRWLENFPRYLAGMRLRLEKLAAGGAAIAERDARAMEVIRSWWQQWLKRKEEHDAVALRDAELQLFRWMLEEYRVFLLAQELGVAVPVSERRMERQWEKVRR